jgi:ABC-type multidrug transport system ATPase subunit
MLLLDEPTAQLDPHSRVSRRLLRDLAGRRQSPVRQGTG